MAMKKLEEGFKNLYKQAYFPFILLGDLYLLLHLLLPHINDDLVIEEGMNFVELTPHYIYYVVVSKYQDWSSRLIINVMTLIMGKLPHIIWILIDTAALVLLAVSISKLAGYQKKRNTNFFILSMILVYPFLHMSTAGWKATTITYLWSLAFGLFAMIPIRKHYDGESFRLYEYIFYLAALLYGVNQEQMAAATTGIFLAASFYFLKEKKINFFIALETLVASFAFFMALLTPGNEKRTIDETIIWFPEYGNLSFINKIEMGFSSAGYKLIFESNWVFIIFSSLLSIIIWKKYKDSFYRLIGSLPLAVSLIFGPFKGILAEGFPGITVITEALTEYGTITTDNYLEASSYLPVIIIGLVIGCILLSFYLIYENTIYSLFMGYLFLVGFTTRLVMAFSPTVWASSWRTYIYMYFSVIILAVFLFQKLLEQGPLIYEKQLKIGLMVIAATSFISTIISI